jgi:diadenylate cyclase
MLPHWEILQPFLAIRVTDVLDILVVSAFAYTMMALLRRTRAAFVAIGILMLGVVYVAARAVGLELTAWMLQGFFAIFLVIVVVIFQEELRQLFERLALWSLRREAPKFTASEPADVLVRCLTDCARDHIGALIVLPGLQPVQRHIEGGIALNGQISVPLLRSIFDPHSPGHDGAAIVENDRVTRFAVHLPLSKDFRQLAGVGTRHSAALGLAELTDALCVVVSEERGSISVARDSRLRELQNPHALGTVLQEFRAALQPRQKKSWAGFDLLRRNWLEKVASLLLVMGLWYLYVPGSRPTTATFSVPVTVLNLPEGYALDEVTPNAVEVTFAGTTRAFYLFDRRSVGVVVDAGLAKVGRRTFQISEQNVRHPADVSIEDIQPLAVKIAVRKAPEHPTPGAAAAEHG